MTQFYLGIDCGGTHLRIGLVDEKAVVLAYSRTKSPLVESSDRFGQTVFDISTQLCASIKTELTTIQALGLGVPGPIDIPNGWILHSANLGNDQPIKFLTQLKTAFQPDLPIYFDRDTEVALLGEIWQGEGRGVKNAIMLTLGTGIGGAILANGQIVSGASDNAGEIGHMYITGLPKDPENTPIPTCGLGHVGCFEAVYRNASQDNKAYILGTALANLVDIFNPEKIILGGGAVEYNQIDITEATKIMQDKAFKPAGQEVAVVKAHLGDRAGVIGAVYLCINQGISKSDLL